MLEMVINGIKCSYFNLVVGGKGVGIIVLEEGRILIFWGLGEVEN